MQNMSEGYQETCYGRLPAEWGLYTIEELCDIVDYRGKTPEKVEEGVFLVTAKNIGKGFIDYSVSKEFIRKDEYNKVMSRGLPAVGDVLFTTEAPLGNVANVDDEEIALAQRVIKLRGNMKKVNNYYLKYFMLGDSFQKEIYAQATGSTVSGIKGSRLKRIPIVTPSIDEQSKIAAILSTVDQQIEQTDALIEKTKELKKGLMQRLLTKGIGHSEFKDTEIGRIPKGWYVKRLGEIVKICYGKNQKGVESEGGKYKILGTGGVIGKTNNYLWDKPSVLIGRKGTIDKPMYIEEPFWTVDTLFYTKVNESYEAKWLYYYLSKIDLKKYNEATGVPSLSVAALNAILLFVPPINEQRKILKILSAVDCYTDIYEIRMNKLERTKKVLMNQLLTGRTRVLVR